MSAPWRRLDKRLEHLLPTNLPGDRQYRLVEWWIKTNPYMQYDTAQQRLMDMPEDELLQVVARFKLEGL